MGQNRATGAAGNEFGHRNAKELAALLGATLTKPGSNEARWEGKLVALKSAGAGTPAIGMTYAMLNRVDEVIAALQRDDGAFDLYALSVAAFRSAMRPTRSKGPSSGRVGMVSLRVFEQDGRNLGMKGVGT
jgi:hypothetical protein